MRAELGRPEVRAIEGNPGRYAISFGEFPDLTIHTTAEQWAQDTADIHAAITKLVAAQIKAAS